MTIMDVIKQIKAEGGLNPRYEAVGYKDNADKQVVYVFDRHMQVDGPKLKSNVVATFSNYEDAKLIRDSLNSLEQQSDTSGLREALIEAGVEDVRVVVNDNGAWDGQKRQGMHTNGPPHYYVGLMCRSHYKAIQLVGLLRQMLALANPEGGVG